MRLYSDLAPWFHLLTHPSDYEDEARYTTEVIEAAAQGPAETLVELGSGGGNNASHLKHRFRCTLTDLSEEMLELSRSINPECEHVQGDMRTLRLGRKFDAVLVHDAVMYMTTEDDLRSALETTAVHLRPGGVAVITPDTTRERFAPATSHGGHDGEDGRSLRYLEWTHDPDTADTTFDVEFVVVLHEPGEPTRVEHDHHVVGLFPDSTWRSLISKVGLELVEVNVHDPHADEHVVYVAQRPSDRRPG
jgi:SAM-dependent methyltransferase